MKKSNNNKDEIIHIKEYLLFLGALIGLIVAITNIIKFVSEQKESFFIILFTSICCIPLIFGIIFIIFHKKLKLKNVTKIIIVIFCTVLLIIVIPCAIYRVWTINNASEESITLEPHIISETRTDKTIEESVMSGIFSTQEDQPATTDQILPKLFSGHWKPPQAPLTIPVLRQKVQVVGDWIYFLYPITEIYDENTGDTWTYTALYRFIDNDADVMLVSEGKCDDYQIAADSVYYVCHNMANYGGELCVSRTDGLAQEILEDWIDKFLIVNEYIYYTYSYDTIGVGTEGYALHRMDLNGGNKIVVAYEVHGIGLKYFDSGNGYRNDFDTDGEYVYGDNYKMKLGAPANGTETLIITGDLTDGYDDEWIYYTTTMLMKCKYDGSQQYILDAGIDTDGDEISDSFFYIEKIDSEWIYYYDQMHRVDEIYDSGYRRISKDGLIKEKINE